MTVFKFLFLSFLVIMLSSCGGGGGGSSNSVSDNNGTSQTSVTAEKHSITVNAVPSNTITKRISLTFLNLTENGVFAGISLAKQDSIILSLDLVQTSETTADLEVVFDTADNIPKGEHTNSITLVFCLDQNCSKHISGSPLTIATTVISEGRLGSISLEKTSITVSGNRIERTLPDTITIPITVKDADTRELFIHSKENSDIYIADTSYENVKASGFDLSTSFQNAANLPLGEHALSSQVSVCFDYDCNQHLEGSPATVDITYKVTQYPEGTELINPTKRTKINHDVIDAEYSKSLNAIIVASSNPTSSVYIYDLSSGTTRQIPLNLLPTSVSVANAGKSSKFAIGHDGKITWVEYNQATPSLSTNITLDIPINVFDLAASEEAVYAVPNDGQWTSLYRLDIATRSVTTSTGNSIYDQSKVKMHPNSHAVYLANRGLSPDDIEKIDISVNPSKYLADSPYHGDYAMCGNLWVSDNGQRIYTACGNTFHASDILSRDMTFSGKIPLKKIDYDTYKIQSVSESPTDNEVAVLQKETDYQCNNLGNCIHYLSFFTKDFLNLSDEYAFDTVSVGGGNYPEKPTHIFHGTDGKTYVITTLLNISTAHSYLLEVQR